MKSLCSGFVVVDGAICISNFFLIIPQLQASARGKFAFNFIVSLFLFQQKKKRIVFHKSLGLKSLKLNLNSLRSFPFSTSAIQKKRFLLQPFENLKILILFELNEKILNKWTNVHIQTLADSNHRKKVITAEVSVGKQADNRKILSRK